jgi:hypothetical protein
MVKGYNMEYISITDAKNIIDILSNHFGIESPVIRQHCKTLNQGYALPVKNEIVISLWSNSWKLENTLLHEFSHILCYHKHGRIKHGLKKIIHGQEFRLCLIEVIKAWYNDIDKYQWNKEYKAIKKWYNKRYNRNE